jgi:hypothetical protein
LKSVKINSDEGSIVLEFIGFGLLLQVPLLMVVLALAGTQHNQLAAEAISRDSLRSFLLIDKQPSITAMDIANEYGLDPALVSITVTCESNDCQGQGRMIKVVTRIGLIQAEAIGLR